MSDRGARLVRGGIAAVFATSAAALSHILGGGNAPHPLLALVSLTISALVCMTLAGRVLSLKNLMAAVVVSEGLFHLLFSISSGDHATMRASAIMSVQHSGMDRRDFPFVSAHMAVDHAGHSSGMWLSHGIAAVLTIVFLRYGEVNAVRLLDALHMRVTAITVPLVAPIPAPLRIDVSPGLWLPVLASLKVPLPVRHHRGPPPLAASASAHVPPHVGTYTCHHNRTPQPSARPTRQSFKTSGPTTCLGFLPQPYLNNPEPLKGPP